jgi:hypothetical protein
VGGEDRHPTAVVSIIKSRSTIGMTVVAADARRPRPKTMSELGQRTNPLPRIGVKKFLEVGIDL